MHLDGCNKELYIERQYRKCGVADFYPDMKINQFIMKMQFTEVLSVSSGDN